MATSERPSFEGLYDTVKNLETEDLQMMILPCHTIIMARKKKMTGYRTPARMFSAGLGGHFERLFTLNKEKGDPLYGALIVNSESKIPSDGFFNAAKRHGLIDDNVDEAGKNEFWKNEVQKTFASEVSVDMKELLSGLSDAQKRDLKTLLSSSASH